MFFLLVFKLIDDVSFFSINALNTYKYCATQFSTGVHIDLRGLSMFFGGR